MNCDDYQRVQKLNGFWRGKVLKHLSNGKCKIWISAIYPDEWNSYEKADLLPDAEQASPLSFGANNGNGVFSYPNIGSIVWCFFARGDQNCPVYFASTLGGSEAMDEWDEARSMAGNHPNDAYVHHVQVKNTHLYLYETGFLKAVTHDNEENNTSTLTMDSDGNITLEGTTTITLKAKNIVLEGSTQIDFRAPNITQEAEVQQAIKSKAINLDSSEGHTTILSRANFSQHNPVINTF